MTTFSQVNGYIHKKFFRYRLHQKTSEIDRILNPAQLKNAVSHIVAVEVTAMQYGTLIVEVTVAQQALPIEGAAIIVTNDDQTVNLRLSSGANGKMCIRDSIKEDEVQGLTYVAEPVGVVAGVTPVTNPTSTAIFKSLICLKTRNPVSYTHLARRIDSVALHCTSD